MRPKRVTPQVLVRNLLRESNLAAILIRAGLCSERVLCKATVRSSTEDLSEQLRGWCVAPSAFFDPSQGKKSRGGAWIVWKGGNNSGELLSSQVGVP